jgi:hypothetical protein
MNGAKEHYLTEDVFNPADYPMVTIAALDTIDQ